MWEKNKSLMNTEFKSVRRYSRDCNPDNAQSYLTDGQILRKDHWSQLLFPKSRFVRCPILLSKEVLLNFACRLTIRELVDMVGISLWSVQTILKDKVGLRTVKSRLVQKFINFFAKERLVQACETMLSDYKVVCIRNSFQLAKMSTRNII